MGKVRGDVLHGMGQIMRRGASGKQYLFLHISCLILQAMTSSSLSCPVDRLKSVVKYDVDVKMDDA